MAAAARSIGDSQLPSWILAPAAIGVGLACLTPNAGLTIAAVVSLAAIILLLRRRREPAALVFMCGMQWLQGSLKVLHADILGVELWASSHAHNIEAAVYLTLAWVVLVAVGARLALSIQARQTHQPVVARMGMRPLLVLYAVWSLAAIGLQMVPTSGVWQVVIAVSNMRWAAVFAIFVVALKTRRGLPIMWAILAFEVALGFLSFFSAFKVPLFILLLAAVSIGQRFSPRQTLLLAIGALATLYLGVVWSAIKSDYRERLNEGTGEQVVAIDTREQIDELFALFGTVDSELLATGFESLVERIAYVDYFANVLDYVPAVRHHEGGKLWLAGFEHVLTPRLLFPDKSPLESDTAVTSRYTGLNVFFLGRQTSITLGLPAITYVDFGPILMLIVAVLVGLLHGAAFGYFWLRAPDDPLAQGFATAVILLYASVESSPEKLLGGQVMTFLVALAMWKLVPALLSLQRPGASLRSEQVP